MWAWLDIMPNSRCCDPIYPVTLLQLHYSPCHPRLAALIALQTLDSAADAARKRLAELPAAEQAIAARPRGGARDRRGRRQSANSRQPAGAARARKGHRGRRRPAGAVRRPQGRRQDQPRIHRAPARNLDRQRREDAIEEQAPGADGRGRRPGRRAEGRRGRAGGQDEPRATRRARRWRPNAQALEAELARLAHERSARSTRASTRRSLAKYEQLLKQRRGIAVARMARAKSARRATSACGRTSPSMVRRNDGVVPCDSCQRILVLRAAARPASRPPHEPVVHRATSTAAPAAIPARPAGASSCRTSGRRWWPNSWRAAARHEQRRGIQRPAGGARLVRRTRRHRRYTSSRIRSCWCSRCAGCIR